MKFHPYLTCNKLSLCCLFQIFFGHLVDFVATILFLQQKKISLIPPNFHDVLKLKKKSHEICNMQQIPLPKKIFF